MFSIYFYLLVFIFSLFYYRLFFLLLFFFFFKQKTAYEMRISDWSSDVCSSDLFKTFHYCTYAPKRLIPQTIILCQNIEGHADILRIDKTDNHLEVFMFKSFLPSAAAAFALLLMSTAASAHTKLVGSTPAANSTVSKVTSVNLQFNEKVITSTLKT